MHDIRFIRENPAAFDRGLARRGLEPQAQRLIALDEKRPRQRSKRLRLRKHGETRRRRKSARRRKRKTKRGRKGLLAEVAELKDIHSRDGSG